MSLSLWNEASLEIESNAFQNSMKQHKTFEVMPHLLDNGLECENMIDSLTLWFETCLFSSLKLFPVNLSR